MYTLQNIFNDILQENFSFPAVGIEFIKRQLKKKNIVLTEEQIDEIKKELLDFGVGATRIEFDLNDEQIENLHIDDNENIKIDLDDEKDLDEFFHEFDIRMEELVPAIIDEMTINISSWLRKDIPTMLKARRKDMKVFEKSLYKEWIKPFDLFEAFLVLAIEAGNDINNEFRKDESEKENYILDALTRLHARACQIASEVLILLKSGFADGAHARWRSLHEVAVVAYFIKTKGNEVAEKYLLHNHINSFKSMSNYNEYYEKLGYDPIPQEECDSIKKKCDELITRFGNAYRYDYGWASSTLNKEKPNFCDIEKESGLDHLRPYYKLASYNVHANAKGIMFKLGLLGDSQNILLAGPSNYGFTDPAHGTALSLGLITRLLLTAKPTIDHIVLSKILLKFEAEIGDEFFNIQKEIEIRDAS